MEFNSFKNDIEINNDLKREQKEFLETTLGKTINTAIDIGIRAIFPEFIDEQIINIKDNLLIYGLKEGISKTVEDAINLGKDTLGILTGNFESIKQMQNVVKAGGLIDGISSLLDTVIEKIEEKGLIKPSISDTIKDGKDIILNSIENNIEQNFKDKANIIEDIEKYINNWNNYFENKNFNGMEREYNKIENQIYNLAPIEKIKEKKKIIQNIHNLIKNNGQDFNLSEYQLELAKKLK